MLSFFFIYQPNQLDKVRLLHFYSCNRFSRFTRSILLCSPFSCRISGNLVIPSSACVRFFPCLLLQSTHPKFTLSFHPSFHTGDEGDLLNIFSVKRFRGFCRGKNGRFRIFGNYNTSLCVVSTWGAQNVQLYAWFALYEMLNRHWRFVYYRHLVTFCNRTFRIFKFFK